MSTKEKWYKKGDRIIIEIPFYSDRMDPWLDDKVGEYKTLTGLIIREKDGNVKYGFAYTIDMDYKDKDDQYTDIVFEYTGEEKDFRKLCGKMAIKLFELNYKDFEI